MKERSNNVEMKLKALPFIPEKIRFFAYRYALECKEPRKFWAGEYGVKVCTVEKWLRHAGVRDYIQICRDKARENTNYQEEIRRKMRETNGGKRRIMSEQLRRQ